MHIPNSERLTYRLMDASDKQALYDIDQNEEVMKFINGGKKNSMQQIEEVFVPRMEKYRNPEKGWGLWHISLTETGEYLGWVLVRPMHFFLDKPLFNDLELGWRFFQHHWGKGYASEAALAIIDVVSASPEVEYVSAIADEDNGASIGVMKKLGMTFHKQYLHKDYLGDWDVVWYRRKVREQHKPKG
ncbi:GNAT family N-acetyltransferase [Thalassotalea agarivorans]|uniref:Protein N-acetyltransferase, RimJ/RimL family n=1 Tax=Thalassotalea agarivorans TaxID=349064 RepID=A0A1I0G409_THASX|nr:GNAT family N-acetyltransferase [Thalassotalea agarivorans]SET64765.1 Protein N-acetyltransferase, RimJ/RimL family [Thalassotalea agarivorans]